MSTRRIERRGEKAIAIPFHRPSLGPEEIEAVVGVMRSGWLTTGPEAAAFEREFAEVVGAQGALAVNSCTAALHLALAASGVGAGDEVLVPTMTFAATAEVVTHLGARPVLVDASARTLQMDLRAAAAAGTPRTKALIAVHYAGLPCDLEELKLLAGERGWLLVEDAAHAFGAGYRGRLIGGHGQLACFSFYATKNLTTGEGGMLTGDDPELLGRARRLSLHGISRDAWSREGKYAWKYEVDEPGFKYNMNDLAAALGRVQLQRGAELQRRREALAARYLAGLAAIPEIEPPAWLPDRVHAWHLFPIRLRLEQLRLERGAFIEELSLRGVGASVHFIPLHLHPHYRRQGWRAEQFPVATAEFDRLVSLPIYPALADGDVDRVLEVLAEIVRRYRR